MLAYVVEFIGTFLFLSVILSNGKNPIAIAVALLAAIYFGGAISGGHFNPAVSFMMYLSKSINFNKLMGYAAVQLLGATAALYFSKLK
jgi:glycerol uptake facilitator-like aquaporin